MCAHMSIDKQHFTCTHQVLFSQVLHSLIGLIKFMGPSHITPVRVKLMGILRYIMWTTHNLTISYVRVGLQFKDEKCLELCCQAWLCFVKKLVHMFNILYSLLWSLLLWTICHLVVVILWCSLDPECLGVLLSQLVVTLSSLMDSYPKIVAEALNYLIIEHRYK